MKVARQLTVVIRRIPLPLMLWFFVLMIGTAGAQPPGSFQPSGAATESCGSWSASRRANNVRSWVTEQWVLGFLSGVAYAASSSGPDPLTGVDDEAVWAWVDNYCRAHPLDWLLHAAVAFQKAHPHG